MATHELALFEQSSDSPEGLRAILRAVPDPMLLVDGDGRLTPLNRPGEHVVDAAAEQRSGVRDRLETVADMARAGLFGDPIPIGVRVDGANLIYEATGRAVGDEVLIICRDVSADTSVREVLLESRQRYKQLVEIGADFVWECDDSGAFSFVSEPGAFGYPPHLLVGRQPAKFSVKADGCGDWPNRVSSPVRERQVSVRTADGAVIKVALNAGPILDSQHSQLGVRGTGRIVVLDQSDQRPLSDEAAPHAPDRIAAIMQAMHAEWRPVDILQNCTAGVQHGFNASGCVILGASDGDQWQVLAEAGEPPHSAHVQACQNMLHEKRTLHLSDANGEVIAIALHCQGHGVGLLIVWRKVGAPAWRDHVVDALNQLDAPCGIAVQQALELKRLTRLSRSDSLTGLLNRRAFLLELTAALARANRHQTPGALIYVDLDNFKRLNDMYGHEMGNQALVGVATILTSAIRPYDLAARMGGDEFVVWLEDISGRDAGRSARRISAAVSDWSRSLSENATLGASIGVAMFDPNTPESPEDLIERADRAMYRAKRTPEQTVAIARRRHRPKAPALP